MFGCIGNHSKAIVGKTISACISPNKEIGAKNSEYMSGKAGGVNYEICTAKDNGFSLMTDKGYVSVNSEGQIYYCKTIDNAGNEKRFSANA
ncbi:MAG: hypothetical protein IJ003_00530 [Candidatus Gastranaerophilales bacterium]|nr:hypothetical protein [Candidatus Gastranaerophilales bacterium]